MIAYDVRRSPNFAVLRDVATYSSYTHRMSKRLQVLLDEGEFDALREVASRDGLTVSEWVRRRIREGRDTRPAGNVARKLEAVRDAATHEFPAGEIDELLSEIERGYGGDPPAA